MLYAQDTTPQMPTGMLSQILGMMPMGQALGTFSPLGGIGGGPGMIEALFDPKTPDVGLNGIINQMGYAGALPEGWKATFKDAAPIAGSIVGNMFAPGVGGPVGAAAGTMGALDLAGGENARYNNPDYYTAPYYYDSGLANLFGMGSMFGGLL
jgi:hypothetical protein